MEKSREDFIGTLKIFCRNNPKWKFAIGHDDEIEYLDMTSEGKDIMLDIKSIENVSIDRGELIFALEKQIEIVLQNDNMHIINTDYEDYLCASFMSGEEYMELDD